MFRRYEQVFRRILLVLDVVYCGLAYVAAYELRVWLDAVDVRVQSTPAWLAEIVTRLPAFNDNGLYLAFIGVAVPAMVAGLLMSRTTDFRCRHRTSLWRYLRATGIGLGALIGAVFLLKIEPVSRAFVFTFAIFSFLLWFVGRVAVLEGIALIRHRRVDGHRVVIVGCSQAAVDCALALRTQHAWDLRLIGFVEIPGRPQIAAAEPRLGDVDAMAEILDDRVVDEVVFVTVDAAAAVDDSALRACEDRGIDITVTLPPTVPRGGKLAVSVLDGYERPLLTVQHTALGDFRMAIKRAMDFVGAVVLLALSAPITVATAIALKCTSKGPILFVQPRMGRNGRTFSMYKFRSMVIDAEARRTELEKSNEVDGPVFKIKRDPRVTAVGRFIRKTSIDELPQLLNVLFGDMSLVGPRPPLANEVREYRPWQRRRLSMKPGLTGLWQVSGRDSLGFEQRVELDLRYIDNWSLWLDLKILFRTVPTVLLGTGS